MNPFCISLQNRNSDYLFAYYLPKDFRWFYFWVWWFWKSATNVVNL